MAFLCPVRIKKNKRKGVPPRKLETPLPGRITGSDSIDTLVRVNYEKDKERGPRARMVVVHDFVPCVDDELAVKRNQQVQVLYQENDWLYVLTENGREGFIPYTYCLPVERSVDDFVLPKSKRSYLTQDVCDHATHDDVPQSNLQKTESKSMPDICGQDKSARNKRTEANGGYATVRNHNQRHLINHTTQEVNNSYNSSNNDRQWHSEDSNVTHDYYNLMPHVTSNERPVSHNSSYKEPNQNSSMSSGGTIRSIQNQSSGYKSENQSANRNLTKYNPQHKFNSLRSQPFYQPHESNEGSVGNFKRSHSLNISQAPVTHHHHRHHSLPDDNQHNQSFESCVSTHFSKKSYGQYIVLFNYTPRQENDVAVKRGEFVTLLNKEDEDWYWIRRSDAIEGFVPKTFLCPAEGQEDSSVSSSQTLPRRYQPTRSNHKPQQLKDNKTGSFPNQRATKLLCLYDYTAEAPDDLTVTRGQWLYSDLENQTDPEWLWAYSTQTNKSGFIPRTHAKLPNFTSYPNTSTHNDPFVSP